MECFSRQKKTHNHFCNYYNDLKRFRETKKLTDVTVEVGERRYEAHGLILSLASNFFRIIFTNDFEEDKKKEVSLKNIDENEFEIILDYMYGDKLRITTENAVFLLMACDYLQIKSASSICYRFILDNLSTIDYTFKLYVFLFLSSDCILFIEVRKYISAHWYEICNCEDILSVSADILKDLLSLKYLITSKDEEIFTICENWIMFDLEKRHPYASELAKILLGKCIFEGKYNLLEALMKYHTAVPYIENLSIPEDKPYLKGFVEVTEDKPWFTAVTGKLLQFYDYNGDSWTQISEYGLTREFDDFLMYASAVLCYENVFVITEFKDITIPKQFYVTNIRTKRSNYLKLPISHYSTNQFNDKVMTNQNNLFNINETLMFCDDWRIYLYSQYDNRWHSLCATNISKFSPNYASDGNYLFAIGSKSGVNNYQTRMVHRFDHRCKNWLKLAPLTRNIGRLASCFFNDVLYVANHELVYSYDTRGNRWTKMTSLDSFNGYGLSMARYKGQIYYLQVFNYLSCFDTSTRTWMQKPRPLLEWNLNVVNT